MFNIIYVFLSIVIIGGSFYFIKQNYFKKEIKSNKEEIKKIQKIKNKFGIKSTEPTIYPKKKFTKYSENKSKSKSLYKTSITELFAGAILNINFLVSLRILKPEVCNTLLI